MACLDRKLLIAALVGLLCACGSSPTASVPPASPSVVAPTPSTAAIPSAVPPPSMTPIPLPSFAQLSAPSANVVWALVAGSRLFRSTDRGDTWEERTGATLVGPTRQIAFIDADTGWIATPGSPGTQCQFQSVGLARTISGGVSWTPLFDARPPFDPDTSGLAGARCKDQLSFVDVARGFLGGWSAYAQPVVFRTVDGGRTWSSSAPLEDPPGFSTNFAGGGSLRLGRVSGFGTTLLVHARGAVAARPVSYAYRSIDGGASWTHAVTIPEPRAAIAFVTATRWLLIAPGGSQETVDGGATWRSFTTDYSQAAGVAPEITFANELVGYATVRGSIQRTVDGGAHWTSLMTPGT